MNRLRLKPQVRRDAADTARLKAAGVPAHINPREERLLKRVMPQAAGPVLTRGLLAEAGTGGDDRVTNLIPAERRLLKRHGGSGDRNPVTGLLRFEDDSGTGNPGGGHDASAAGGPGSGGGYGGGIGSSVSSGGNYSSNYSTGVGYGFSGPATDLSYSDISNFGGVGRNTIGPGGNMDSFASPIGALTNAGLQEGYAPLDTVKRLIQTAIWGPPKQYSIGPPGAAMPGRLSAPTARGPGIARTMAGMLGGPAISSMMTLGGWMGAAMSPAAQAASMAESQARGTANSGGNQGTFAGTFAGRAPGTASGAETARMPDMMTPGGPTNALAATPWIAGDTPSQEDDIDLQSSISRKQSSADRASPLRNLLIDYVLSGRPGGNWWS